jgi:hypothetical protein
MNDVTKRAPTPSLSSPPGRTKAADFLAKEMAADKAHGRLIFALDATASREPLWNTARQLQTEMFYETAAIGGLNVQLVFYRGECKNSRWVSRPEQLADLMAGITCVSGGTQIGRVLAHAKRETQTNKVQTLVFVGDAMEEKLGELCDAAAELGRLGVPAFMFQEGDDPKVEQAFREIARLTRRAYARFDPNAPDQLRELLRGAAAFTVGGVDALKLAGGTSSTKLLSQLKNQNS